MVVEPARRLWTSRQYLAPGGNLGGKPLRKLAAPTLIAVRKKMSRHLYNVGEAVALIPHWGHYLKPPGAYVVSAQMPPLGNVPQYRIKCASEPYERVVAEHQLDRLDAESKPPFEAMVSPARNDIKTWAGRGIHTASAVAPRIRSRSRPR